MSDMRMTDSLTRQEKTVFLFQFIEELNKLKQKIVLHVSDYPWCRAISSFPKDLENIHLFYRDCVVEEDNSEASPVLLSVHKPKFRSCPEPDDCFAEWLHSGWDSYHNESRVREFITRSVWPELHEDSELPSDDKIQTVTEYFTDDTERVQAYEAWLQRRASWADQQQIYEKTRDLFTELYNIYVTLERDAETMELIVADGFIRDHNAPEIDHPILTRRIKIRHDAVENTIYIEDVDVEPELYTVMFQTMKDINLSAINHLNEDLHKHDYHPLDRNDTPIFFGTLIHQLSPESMYSENGVPQQWQKEDRLLLYRNPCYILRKRMDGTLKAVDQIIEHIEHTGEVPNPIGDIVEGGKIDIPKDTDEFSVAEQLAAVGGESIDILLSKEANKEQLEIARRIERYNAVLVQGPPGTGKTHTIANLMGHFLAQGKSVLVTSHTKKALSVLKEKIAPELQSLCVSMLDDSNMDMEKSIDGITDRMARHTSFDMKKEMDALGLERKNIIDELAETRKRLFAMIHQECSCIVYNGESISPSDAAVFVQQNAETLSYIPGKVRLYEPLPLSFSELSDLYRSNEVISVQDETELKEDIPDPIQIMAPEDFKQEYDALDAAKDHLKRIFEKHQWKIKTLLSEGKIEISAPFGQFLLDLPDQNATAQLQKYLSTFGDVEPWMQHCAVDGKKGGTYRQLWERLIAQIQKCCDFSEHLMAEMFGKDVKILDYSSELRPSVEQLREKYVQKGKIGKFDLLFNKHLEIARNGAVINGMKPQNAADCDLILHVLEMQSIRSECASYWNNLLGRHGVPAFDQLDDFAQEQIAANYISLIERYLDWYKNEYTELEMRLANVGLDSETIFQRSSLDSDITVTGKILCAIQEILPIFCDVFSTTQRIYEISSHLSDNQNTLLLGKRSGSRTCKTLAAAAEKGDVSAYQNSYTTLKTIYAKYDLQRKRNEYINRLKTVAPQWAEAIRTRTGIHGENTVPSDIDDAWKWKQYSGIIENITAEPFAELQKKSLFLSKRYREITAQFAEKSAWYHLLSRTECDISMKQALVGWMQTVRKIGKGTGKNAPKHRAKARRLMAKCQNAVPGWIMTIQKALESLNPQQNKFDIIIIDEASQSDVSSLAILYMGRKLIIVGDDKQVSPMAVGAEVNKMNALQEMYIANKIPNAHLYDAKTSIYDIAATTFQPLMLREHFRCVPEIIGFSNWLSYDFKIKPLRDSSNSVLLPAVVNYRVADGQRIGKNNPAEATTIVALMRACMEQPEYIGKSFGVISLLGDDQVRTIQEEINRRIDEKTCSDRRILCGNASNFQGDERDVIFLSLVDCANGNGPVAKQAFGIEDAYRKRYNVATSRARDQLWVVHSFDPANDLKPGDIRKMLIDYSLDPALVNRINASIEEKSESPFELAVSKYLAARGYHLVQQWEVGAYRLDIVVVYGTRKVAIECDGERFHSGEDKIREDMERQTILERLGWRFIRIRGSEYYRDPDKTMEQVVSALTSYGIEPEEEEICKDFSGQNTDLLQRIKSRAHTVLCAEHAGGEQPDIETISAALAPLTDNLPEVMPPESKLVLPQIQTLAPQVDEPQNIFAESQDHAVEKRAPTIGKTEDRADAAQSLNPIPEQITLPGMEDYQVGSESIIDLLQTAGIQYVDKRLNGGSLWMIGGKELSDIAAKAKLLGYVFRFNPKGGRATKNQPSWWTK